MENYISSDDNVEVLTNYNHNEDYTFVQYKLCKYALYKEKLTVTQEDAVMLKNFDRYICYVVEINPIIEIYHLPTYIEFQNIKYYIMFVQKSDYFEGFRTR